MYVRIMVIGLYTFMQWSIGNLISPFPYYFIVFFQDLNAAWCMLDEAIGGDGYGGTG